MRGSVEHVFTVVEDDQHLLRLGVRDEALFAGQTPARRDPEGSCNDLRNRLRVVREREVAEPAAIAHRAGDRSGHVQRQPSLARPTSTGERHQPCPLECIRHRAQSSTRPTNELTAAGRFPVGLRDLSGGKSRGNAGCTTW